MKTDVSRRLDIDWLRIGVVFFVMIGHAQQVFHSKSPYWIKNPDLSVGVEILYHFTAPWLLKVLFVLSGWSVYASLKNRGAFRFAYERTRKILIPFLAGCFLLIPFMRYVEVVNGTYVPNDGSIVPPGFSEQTFLEFLPTFLTFAGFSWGHLWFLIYLLTFNLVYIPVFLIIDKILPDFKKVSAIWCYIPILVLSGSEFLLRPLWPGYHNNNLYADWANFSLYSLFFILGFLMARVPNFEKALHSQWKVLGGIGLAATIISGLPIVSPIVLSDAMLDILNGVASWGVIVCMLGFCFHYSSSRETPTFTYLRDSSFAFYVIHSNVLVAIAILVIPTGLSIASKFILLCAGTPLLTFLAYELIFRSVPPLRFLFMVKPRKSRRQLELS